MSAGYLRYAIRTGRARRDRGFNVCRPSALGNPFKIGVDGNRDEIIAKYRTWLSGELQTNVKVQRAMERLERAARQSDITLLCFCAPLPCHADVVAELLCQRIDETSKSSL